MGLAGRLPLPGRQPPEAEEAREREAGECGPGTGRLALMQAGCQECRSAGSSCSPEPCPGRRARASDGGTSLKPGSHLHGHSTASDSFPASPLPRSAQITGSLAFRPGCTFVCFPEGVGMVLRERDSGELRAQLHCPSELPSRPTLQEEPRSAPPAQPPGRSEGKESPRLWLAPQSWCSSQWTVVPFHLPAHQRMQAGGSGLFSPPPHHGNPRARRGIERGLWPQSSAGAF